MITTLIVNKRLRMTFSPLQTASPNHLILYPTIGTLSPDGLKYHIDVHGWIFDTTRQTKLGRAVLSVLRKKLNLVDDASIPQLFHDRAGYFAVYPGKRRSALVQIGGFHKVSPPASRQGQFKETLAVPREWLMSMTDGRDEASIDLRASIHAPGVPLGPHAQQVQQSCFLLANTGLSLISDIDDTIKDTVVRNKQELLINTFLNPFRAIEGMAELYRDLTPTVSAFHYVSASPWQIYVPLSQFLEEQGFPMGSLHLRKFGLKDVTFLKKLSPSHKQKGKSIHALISRAPHRRFLLVGDSGEKDPELYASIYHRYPSQIAGLFIRNVPGADNSTKRYQKAFSGIPAHLCGSFEQAQHLRDHLQPFLANATQSTSLPAATLPMTK